MKVLVLLILTLPMVLCITSCIHSNDPEKSAVEDKVKPDDGGESGNHGGPQPETIEQKKLPGFWLALL